MYNLKKKFLKKDSLFNPGKNCWRVVYSERAACLVDAQNYFGALYESFCKARHSIWILAWDLNSKIRISGKEQDHPVVLCDCLLSLLNSQPDLHVYILLWDFSVIFSLDREWSALLTRRWSAHPRMHFMLDNRHPFPGSQHQKIVVIDDSVAYVGGLDLTHSRMDTRLHRPNDPIRMNPDGKSYQPFHDVQILVDAEAAYSLAELARWRWRNAGVESVPDIRPSGHSVWPDSIQPDFSHVRLAISRTLPEYEDSSEVREVERMYLDLIGRAKDFIYIENQYLTSAIIRRALIKRLQSKYCPEIIIILPRSTAQVAEKLTMDAIRGRLLQRFRKKDKHRKLRIYFPHDPDLPKDQCIMIHSKIMIVDNNWLRVGSSNLSNRSMGLDTECDIVLEAVSPEERETISGFLFGLLAEHLNLEAPEVIAVFNDTGSLIETIESLREPEEKTLVPLQVAHNEVSLLTPFQDNILDPDSPFDPERFMNEINTESGGRPERAWLAWLKPLILLTFIIGVIVLWRWTPLNEWVSLSKMKEVIDSVENYRWSEILILSGFVILASFGFPLTLLIVIAAVALGPWYGFLCAIIGGMLSALLVFSIGRFFGGQLMAKAKKRTWHNLIDKLRKRAVLTMIAVRTVPVAPFVVVCAVAGAAKIRWRDYMAGSLLGSLPGTAMLTVFAETLRRSFSNPDMSILVLSIAILLILLMIVWILRRKLRKYA